MNTFNAIIVLAAMFAASTSSPLKNQDASDFASATMSAKYDSLESSSSKSDAVYAPSKQNQILIKKHFILQLLFDLYPRKKMLYKVSSKSDRKRNVCGAMNGTKRSISYIFYFMKYKIKLLFLSRKAQIQVDVLVINSR